MSYTTGRHCDHKAHSGRSHGHCSGLRVRKAEGESCFSIDFFFLPVIFSLNKLEMAEFINDGNSVLRRQRRAAPVLLESRVQWGMGEKRGELCDTSEEKSDWNRPRGKVKVGKGGRWMF